MMGAKTIGCINHPSLLAVGRCRQCSKPVCKECGIVSSAGLYCSEVCQEKHSQFLKRAGDLETTRSSRLHLGLKFRKLLGLLITLIVILCVLGMISYHTYIPLLTDLTARVLSVLPF